MSQSEGPLVLRPIQIKNPVLSPVGVTRLEPTLCSILPSSNSGAPEARFQDLEYKCVTRVYDFSKKNQRQILELRSWPNVVMRSQAMTPRLGRLTNMSPPEQRRTIEELDKTRGLDSAFAGRPTLPSPSKSPHIPSMPVPLAAALVERRRQGLRQARQPKFEASFPESHPRGLTRAALYKWRTYDYLNINTSNYSSPALV